MSTVIMTSNDNDDQDHERDVNDRHDIPSEHLGTETSEDPVVACTKLWAFFSQEFLREEDLACKKWVLVLMELYAKLR